MLRVTGVRSRVQVPSRLAPFAGVGLFAGKGFSESDAQADGIDNDHDGVTDEVFEQQGDDRYYSENYIGAIYPELGVHFWLTPSVRLTGSAAYYLTTAGRDHDFVYYSVGIGFTWGRGPVWGEDNF